MLPVCSATPRCSSYSQISFHSGSSVLSRFPKDFEFSYEVQDRCCGTQFRGRPSKTQAIKCLCLNDFANGAEKSCSSSGSLFVGNLERNLPNTGSSMFTTEYEQRPVWREELIHVETSGGPVSQEGLIQRSNQSMENMFTPLEGIESEVIATSNTTSENFLSLSDSVDMANNSLYSMKTSIENFFAGANESFSSSVNNGEKALKESTSTFTSLSSNVIKNANEAVDTAISGLFSSIDRVGEGAGNKVTSFSAGLKEATSKTAVVAVEALRRTIVTVEDALTNVTSLVVYSYGSAKQLLPPQIQNNLSLSEEKVIEILSPIGAGLKQVYITIEDLEKTIGLDPNDPIVAFVLFLGSSATLWFLYWVWTYGGYSGDLSPQSTLDILTGNDNAVLIDIRPENLRENDGIPDLRRGTRYRYTCVALPEIDGSIIKLLKKGRELDDTLLAAVIRNLKIVQDRSKVIVMDADGSRSKSIARSLRKLGVKKAFLIQGGFKSWVKQGLRIKELKPETTLTILNEDAEAILEDIRPSPVAFLGYGLVLAVASYALIEWEKTLQVIGIIGLSQSIYRRVAFYEDVEAVKKDLRLLLTPVRLGVQAFSWAAGKLETNGIGLATTPSSSDVQSRVLQAAARHESQPSDSEGFQNSAPDSTMPVSDTVDLSEA